MRLFFSFVGPLTFSIFMKNDEACILLTQKILTIQKVEPCYLRICQTLSTLQKRYYMATLARLNTVSGRRLFPTKLIFLGKCCCIVRILEECVQSLQFHIFHFQFLCKGYYFSFSFSSSFYRDRCFCADVNIYEWSQCPFAFTSILQEAPHVLIAFYVHCFPVSAPYIVPTQLYSGIHCLRFPALFKAMHSKCKVSVRHILNSMM